MSHCLDDIRLRGHDFAYVEPERERVCLSETQGSLDGDLPNGHTAFRLFRRLPFAQACGRRRATRLLSGRSVIDLTPENRSTFKLWNRTEKEESEMPRKRYRPEEIIAKLRQAEVLINQG